jgi:hypothetical protein
MKRHINPEIVYYHLFNEDDETRMAVLQANESVIMVAGTEASQRFLVALDQTPGKYNYIKHPSIQLATDEPLTLYSPINGKLLSLEVNMELAMLRILDTITNKTGKIWFATANGVQATKIEWSDGIVNTWGKDARQFWPYITPTILENQENKVIWTPNENDYYCPHCSGFLKIKASILLKAEGMETGNQGLVLLSDKPGDYDYYKNNLFHLKDKEQLILSCSLCQTNLAHPRMEGMAHLRIINPKKGEGGVFFASKNGEHATYITWDDTDKTEHFGDSKEEFINYFGAEVNY